METSVPISTPKTAPLSLSSLPHSSSLNTNRNTLQVYNFKPPSSTTLSQQQLTVPRKWQFRDTVSGYLETTPLRSELSVRRIVTIIEGFGDENKVPEASKIHAVLIKNGYYAASLDIKACLAAVYLKCGKIELASRVFDECSERKDVAFWSDMVVGFARRSMRLEALQCVRLMVEEGINPNLFLMTVVIPLIGELSALRIGQEVHGYLVKKKLFYEQARIRTALVFMYCKCDDVGSGRRVLCSSMDGNVSHWIEGYASRGRIEQAVRSLIRMKREGFRHNVATVASVLSVCAQSRALKRGKEIHAYALKHMFMPHVSIVSSLMLLYSKCGAIEYSRKLFDGMERGNVILWTAMIDSYVENGCLYEALGVIRLMQSTEHRPDTVTFARMLSVCSRLKLAKLGKEIHGQVLKRDFAWVHYVSAELINMYGSCGVVDKAKLVFNAVPVKGSMTWTALIRAYGYKEWYQDAIDLFDHMISNGCAPNHFTFEVVLSMCDKAGYVEDAFRIFSLLSRFKIEASKEHCFLMVRLLTRYGKLDEAQRFLELSSSL